MLKHLFILATLLMSVFVFAESSEQEKVEALIKSVENAPKGTVFIRNGVSYNMTEAANHLRTKYRFAKVKTVREFIDHVASRSSQTGEEYLVTLPDNTTIKSKEYFEMLLKR